MPNKMERFSQRARRVLSLAQEAAEGLQHHRIRPEHLLLGLMREDGGVAGRVLRDLGLDLRSLEELIAQLPAADKETASAQWDLSASTKKVLELAVDEARRIGHNYIGTEHLLLGLVRLQASPAHDILSKLNVTREQIRQQVAAVMQDSPTARRSQDIPRSFRRPAPRHFDYFLLRMASRSSGEISHLTVQLSAEVKNALEESLKEVGHTGFLMLDDRHLVLGLLQDRDGVLRSVLLEAGLDLDELIRDLRHADDA